MQVRAARRWCWTPRWAACRRLGVGAARGREDHAGVRLRPRRARVERARPRTPRRPAGHERAARAPFQRRHPGPLCGGGHSLGGLYAQLYADRYPQDVAGVASVESSHPQQFDRLPGGQQIYERTRQLFAVAPVLTWSGVVRMFDLSPPPSSLPPEQRDQVAAWACSTRHAPATAAEFRATPDTTAQADAVGGLGDRPLAVIRAGRSDADLASPGRRNSPHCRRTAATGSSTEQPTAPLWTTPVSRSRPLRRSSRRGGRRRSYGHPKTR